MFNCMTSGTITQRDRVVSLFVLILIDKGAYYVVELSMSKFIHLALRCQVS